MTYPFSALVAQDDLKLCLMLIAVQPRIGGVLIRGDKGAAKSTAARGIADLLPPLKDEALEGRDAPFVNLPLGSSEDRVIGALDLEHALRGERKLQTGLLGQADGGVLYIDEVNLLADPLVDVLLDAAATGVNRVERDGLSVEQASRFALIGSMNPEEGTLRPQFLDRFGLCVDIVAPREPALRAEIVRRRLRFEHDAKGFVAQYIDEQEKLKALLHGARTHLPNITVPDDVLTAIAERCQAAHVSSLRADLVLTRSAIAYAALQGAHEVTSDHAERVAPFVFAHRRANLASHPPTHQRRGSPHSDEQKTPPGPSHSNADSETTDSKTTGSKEVDSKVDEPMQDMRSPDQSPRPRRAAQPDQTFGIGAVSGTPIDLVSPRGSKQAANTSRGRLTRSVKTATPQHLAVNDSVRHAFVRTALGGEAFSTLTTDDLHEYQKEDRERERVLFVVDSSGSLAERKRMANVKGVVATMLEEVREQRREVSLITFRGARAECVVPWTRDIARTIAALEALPTGGRTPLAHALELVDVMADVRVSVALFTDGKSNVPLQSGDAWQDALDGAGRLREFRATVMDTEEGPVRLGRARELAEAMAAAYISLVA